MDGETEALNQ